MSGDFDGICLRSVTGVFFRSVKFFWLDDLFVFGVKLFLGFKIFYDETLEFVCSVFLVGEGATLTFFWEEAYLWGDFAGSSLAFLEFSTLTVL